MADPLDKQLVEAVLSSRPRRTRRELEEAKLASMRPRQDRARRRCGVDPDADPDLETRTTTTTTISTSASSEDARARSARS